MQTQENEIPRAKPGLVCHRHGKDVSETCHVCPLFLPTEQRSVDANKQVHVHKFYQCADITLPMTFASLSQQIRELAAETEAARKEVAESTEAIRAMKDADHSMMASAVLGKIAEVGAIAMQARITDRLIGNR